MGQLILEGMKKVEIRGSNIWKKFIGTWIGLHIGQDLWKGEIPEEWREFVQDNQARMYRKRGRIPGKYKKKKT